MNERKTEKLVRAALVARGYEADGGITVEEQSSDNPRIRKLLKRASKAGTGIGSPEFIISSAAYPNLVIVIECKASTARHRSPELDKPKEFACDGALHYAAYLAADYDVIAIGVSGENQTELRIDVFAHLRGEHVAFELPAKGLLSFHDLYAVYVQSPEKFRADYVELLDYSQALNRTLHKLKVKESQRSLLISSILIALKSPAFVAAFQKHKKAGDLASSLVKTVVDELKNSDIPADKIANLTQAYTFIQTHTTLISTPNALVNLISDVDAHINGFMKTHSYFDTIGQFYIEFLRYANNDKGLGIVLTPPHITDLFAALAEISRTSVVCDSCCGTGGFLISAMKRMVLDCAGDSELIEKVKKTQLIGVEAQSDIYALAISNMILQDDGKSSIISGDCFELVEYVSAKKPTAGLLNPPYKAEKDDIEEFEYVLNNLEMLAPGGLSVSLVPISCVVAQEGPNLELKRRLLEKHSLLAVMSLPEDLFHNSKVGVVTCAMVFQAHAPHKHTKKTWLAYWRDDGFEKTKGKGRIDKRGQWPSIYERWVNAYENREEVPGQSLTRHLKAEDEWCVEAYMSIDYSSIDKDALKRELRRYMAFEILTGQE